MIDGIDPYNLIKAGTYATSLTEALAADIAPRRIIGHGPQVARHHALAVLSRYADPDGFADHLSADMTVSRQP